MTDRLHLETQHRSVLEALAQEHLPGVEVWAYGSCVNGSSHNGSHLNLVLRGAGLKEIPAGQLVDFEEAVRESRLPFLVEARDWARLSEQVRREIERGDGVLVWEKQRTLHSKSTGWSEQILGNLIDNFDSVRIPIKKEERQSGPYPYYGASGIVDHINEYLFNGEYLLIAEDGENLRTRNTPVTFVVSGKFWVNNHAHIVRGNQKADTRYLMYALSKLDISGYLTGSTMPKLTQGNMNQIRVVISPLPQQRAIAHILGTLDDKIELNRRMNETLEAMAQAIFKDWFVDFGPVRAKMEGREPYLPKGIWDLFPDKLDDEGKPEGWKTYKLSDLALHHRATISPSSEPKRIFEHYSIPAYDSSKAPSLDSGDSIKSNKVVVADGAVLLSKLNPEIARVWLPNLQSQAPQIASTEFLTLTPLHPATRSVLYCLFQSPSFRAEMVTMVTGTSKSHQRVPPKALLACDMLVADPQLLLRFDSMVHPFLDQLLVGRHERQALAQTRDALLPKLISGEIRLGDAEKMMEAVR